jgi:hypothetical protein
MTSTILRKTMTVVFAICLMITAAPKAALGESTIIGDSNGLEIHIPPKSVDTGNLNPGDKMYSCLRIVNTGSNQLSIYIKTNIKSESEKPLFGGRLADVMTLTIKVDGSTIAEDIFRQVAKQGNIYIGEMSSGEERTICFFTNLPESAGNEYQGASFKANWAFTTQTSGSGGDGPDKPPRPPKDDPTPKPPKDEEVPPMTSVEDEPVPEGPGETEVPSEPEIIIVEDDDIPTGPYEMPATGETPPFCYYGTGALVVMLGMAMKKEKDRAGK